MSLVERILVPVDFSDCARRACASAVALAERTRASVDLLHVQDLGHAARAWAPVDVLAFDNGRALLGDAIGINHTLARWVEELERQSPVPIGARIERGDRLHTILEVARRDRYDLIVMGTHGRTGISLLLLGSLTRDVMRRAPCPVLTVHPSEKREGRAKRASARFV